MSDENSELKNEVSEGEQGKNGKRENEEYKRGLESIGSEEYGHEEESEDSMIKKLSDDDDDETDESYEEESTESEYDKEERGCSIESDATQIYATFIFTDSENEVLSHLDVHKWSKKLSKKIENKEIRNLNLNGMLTQGQFNELINAFCREDNSERDPILFKIDPIDLFAYLKVLPQLFLHISYAQLHNIISKSLKTKLQSKNTKIYFTSKTMLTMECKVKRIHNKTHLREIFEFLWKYPIIENVKIATEDYGVKCSEIVCEYGIPETVKVVTMDIDYITNEGITLLGINLNRFSCHQLNIKNNAKYNETGLLSLSRGIATSTTIKSLRLHLLSFKQSGSIIANGIVENKSVQELILEEDTYDDRSEFTNEFVEIFGKATTLLSLTILTCDLRKSGIYFKNFLTQNHVIQKLHLENDLIGDQECELIVEGMKIGQSLTTLELVNNDIGDKGGLIIVGALPECPKLGEISLDSTKVTNITATEFSNYFGTYAHPIPHVSLNHTNCNVQETELMKMIMNQRMKKPDSFITNMKIREYEFLYELGAGNYGTTYLVRKEKDFFAMKILEEKGDVENAEKTFEEIVEEAKWEVEIMQTLNHRNIVGFKDSFTIDEKYFILMQIATNSLSSKKRTDKDFKSKCIKYCRGIAEGIASMHGSKICHLDLKPDNIFLDGDDEILIGDFGLSNTTTTKKGVYKYLTTDYGTPPFVAPEIWLGKEFKFEPDIFAFGVILYELETGYLPWVEDGSTLQDRIIELKYDITRLQKSKKEINDLFLRCMTFERKERIQIWDVLAQMNKLHGEKYLWRLIISLKEKGKLAVDLDIENLIGNKFGYSKTKQEWIIFSDNENELKEQIASSSILKWNIRFASINSIYYKQNNKYMSEMTGVSGVFFTEIFESGKSIQPKTSIIKWILEIIFPLKYLHDNNMYYMNLNTSNLLLDKSKRLLLGPSKYKIPDARNKYNKDKIDLPLPELEEGSEMEEILGIYRFWYELCTGIEYNVENSEFEIIQERYGGEWRKEIENALTEGHGASTFEDLYGNYCYIYLYIQVQ